MSNYMVKKYDMSSFVSTITMPLTEYEELKEVEYQFKEYRKRVFEFVDKITSDGGRQCSQSELRICYSELNDLILTRKSVDDIIRDSLVYRNWEDDKA